MTVKEFYDITGGDYEEAITRLMKDSLIIRFSGKFLEDDSFADLQEGMKTGDAELAFRSAHTLKGLALNLGYTKLAASAADITEILRGRELEKAQQYLEPVEKDYRMIVNCIQELLESQE